MSKNFKLSIILPFFNAAKEIPDVFASIASQQGISHEQIEIVIINDGSSDNTLEVIEKEKSQFSDFGSVRVLANPHNYGLAKTRHLGAEAAQADFITFIDARTRPEPDYLANMVSKQSDIVIGNVYMDKYRSIWDRVLHLIRRKIYPNYYGREFLDISLDAEAYRKFENKGGGGAMYVKKSYFLIASEKISHSKHSSDDTKLIEQLAENGTILKTYSARTKYLNRTTFKENISHLLRRGPKFVDYYLKPGTRFFKYIVLLLILILSTLVAIAIHPPFFLGLIVLSIIALTFFVFWLAEEPSDLLPLILVLPLTFFVFCTGVLWGVWLKLTKKL